MGLERSRPGSLPGGRIGPLALREFTGAFARVRHWILGVVIIRIGSRFLLDYE